MRASGLHETYWKQIAREEGKYKLSALFLLAKIAFDNSSTHMCIKLLKQNFYIILITHIFLFCMYYKFVSTINICKL